MMVQPTMMLCGHMYCFRCLESSAVYSQRCCLCRQPQMDVPHLPSRFAEKLIHQYYSIYSEFCCLVLTKSSNISAERLTQTSGAKDVS